MKKVLLAVCSICLAAAAAAAPLSAFAAENTAVPEYPVIFDDSLTFEYLMDFAVADDNHIAFADDATIVLWKNENTTIFGDGGEDGTGYTFDKFVTNVDYAGGKFYYSLDNGKTTYILPDSPENLPGDTATHDFTHNQPTTAKPFSKDGYFYYTDTEGKLNVYNTDTKETTPLNNLYNAKAYDNRLYAIDSHKTLCEVIGITPTQANLAFSNYEKLTTILLGDAPQKLNTYSTFGENPKIVDVKQGSIVTELNLEALTSLSAADKYFPITLSQAKSNTYTNFEGGEALLLCEVGNIRIVAIGTKTYIMDKADAKDVTEGGLVKTNLAEGTATSVYVAGEYAHSLPFMNDATRTFPLAAGEKVTVISKLSKTDNGMLAHDFYLIENAAGERGYVAAEFLNAIDQPIADEGDPYDNPDPDFSTASSVKTVIIVIVVVALVLIGVGYLTWLSSTAKRKKAQAAKSDDNLNDTEDQPKQDNK